MADIESLLTRWRTAGVLDAEAEVRIRAFEQEQKKRSELRDRGPERQADVAGMRWQGIVALILGGILLTCGVALFVSAHWDELGPGARYAIVIAMVAVFHLGGGFTRDKFIGLSTTLHAVGTVATGAAIALVGQIFNIQEHWPAAVLMWALAALAGWMLLRDQAQQTLSLLLVPAWMISEMSFSMDRHIGQDVFIGRALFTWAILYLTFFAGSERKVVQGILFAASSIAAVTGTVFMLMGWVSWSSQQTFVPFSVRAWAWIAIAALPLVIAAFHGHKGLVPIALAVGYAIALPWCIRVWTETNTFGTNHFTFTRSEPNFAAHAVVALFAVFICGWGVRVASRMLVNLGIVSFAVAVAWFYFSDIFSKVGRSLGLAGLGVLFLAGGWVLERTRRRLMAHMEIGELEMGEGK
ncbi:MAG TPA: DUF2157 domain-containing protein [Terracidiphilus sp.]|nr:DUF2157 domain-containing protein [Terracidiphilus sp.]